MKSAKPTKRESWQWNANQEVKRAAIVTTNVDTNVERMFDEAARSRIAEILRLYPDFLTLQDIESEEVDLSEIHVLFGTWGFPRLSASQIAKFKNLQHVFYAAGSIKRFGLPFLEAGIPISNAKAANSRVVADFCLAQILLASKRYFQDAMMSRSPWKGRSSTLNNGRVVKGFCGSRVALIGCGMVSRFLIERLKRRDFELFVVDPFLSEEEGVFLGVKKVAMEEAFSQCDIVSNHLPKLPHLEGVIKGQHFASMLEGAAFLNTGRGAQVREHEMVDVLRTRKDLFALLDVTDPEPPEKDSELYALPNVLVSSHIAGCVGEETRLLVDEAIESAGKWLQGEALDNLETLDRFDLIA